MATESPAPPPASLQQEDIVRIHVRPDAAAVGGETHHQIVEPRIGHEPKARKQASSCIVEQIHTLYQQRPTPARERRQAKERSVLQCLGAVERGKQAAFRLRILRKFKQARAIDRWNKACKRGANQQRFALPVFTHELPHADRTQLAKNCGLIHRTIIESR